jgi:hypothetical protein
MNFVLQRFLNIKKVEKHCSTNLNVDVVTEKKSMHSYIGKGVKQLDSAVGKSNDGDAHVLDELQVSIVVRLEVGPQQLALDQLLLCRTFIFNNVGKWSPGNILKQYFENSMKF